LAAVGAAGSEISLELKLEARPNSLRTEKPKTHV